MPELFIGLMSGTSVDAIDSVLMDLSGSASRVITHFSQTLHKTLKNEIHRVIMKRTWPQDLEDVDREFALASSKAVHHLLHEASIHADRVTAIGSHGQTVYHDPSGTPAISIQIGSPGQIACITGIQTVGEFRQADIDAGGQGAPLACAYHETLFRTVEESRTIVNLGGIANITYLPADPALDITGFDTGPANTLSDAWARKHLALDFDHDGEWAQAGTIDRDLLHWMLEDPYFKQQPPKSTGREKFNLSWLQQKLDQHARPVREVDIQATLVELTAQSVAQAVQSHAPQTSRILLCGGGCFNAHLVSSIRQAMQDVPVACTGTYGAPEKWMEAMAFAWLARQNLKGVPGNIPSVTGASEKVVLGNLYQPDSSLAVSHPNVSE